MLKPQFDKGSFMKQEHEIGKEVLVELEEWSDSKQEFVKVKVLATIIDYKAKGFYTDQQRVYKGLKRYKVKLHDGFSTIEYVSASQIKS